MADENWYWLGTNPIDRREKRVILPHAVVDADLIRVESDIAWAHDDAYDVVAISGREKPFEGDRYEHLGDSTIGDEPILPVPGRVIERFETVGPGESLHFATTDELGRAGRCLLLSGNEADVLLENAQAMSGSVNSGRVRDGL